jgi:uncharacterized membrane protein (DUF2068 family)
LRSLALIEAAKGLIVLLVGCGVSGLLHHRARHTVEMLVNHFHLNPAHHTPQVFLKLAENFDNTKLWLLAGGAATYAMIRFVEAYGLWRERRWAEWLGCVGAAIYVPLELKHFVEHPNLVSTIVLGTNVLIVVYLAVCLWKGRGERGMREPDLSKREELNGSGDGDEGD